MTSLVREQAVIDKLAGYFQEIDGIKRAYPFAQNPDTLSDAQLAAALFVPTAFSSEPKAHFNFWNNDIEVTVPIFVAPRQSAGGRLKFIENRAIPLLGKIRTKFETAAVVRDLLSLGFTRYTFTGTYGAGGTLLTHNGVEYIGCIIRFVFVEIS